jgi:hypothetical protein
MATSDDSLSMCFTFNNDVRSPPSFQGCHAGEVHYEDFGDTESNADHNEVSQ